MCVEGCLVVNTAPDFNNNYEATFFRFYFLYFYVALICRQASYFKDRTQAGLFSATSKPPLLHSYHSKAYTWYENLSMMPYLEYITIVMQFHWVIIVALPIDSWRLFNSLSPSWGPDILSFVWSSSVKKVAFTLGTHPDITRQECVFTALLPRNWQMKFSKVERWGWFV